MHSLATHTGCNAHCFEWARACQTPSPRPPAPRPLRSHATQPAKRSTKLALVDAPLTVQCGEPLREVTMQGYFTMKAGEPVWALWAVAGLRAWAWGCGRGLV